MLEPVLYVVLAVSCGVHLVLTHLRGLTTLSVLTAIASCVGCSVLFFASLVDLSALSEASWSTGTYLLPESRSMYALCDCALTRGGTEDTVRLRYT